MQRRKLEELNLMDDFLFNAMLTHPETGEKFTHTILKLLFNRDFKNLKVSAQKFYAGMNTDLRGARLDVCIEGDCVDIDGEDIPSVYTVLGECMSAGRLYDKIGKQAIGAIKIVTGNGIICAVSTKKKK